MKQLLSLCLGAASPFSLEVLIQEAQCRKRWDQVTGRNLHSAFLPKTMEVLEQRKHTHNIHMHAHTIQDADVPTAP